MDREKVIEGLEKVWDAFNHMEHELYADYVFDALAMLKEQEGQVQQWTKEIADNQLAHAPNDWKEFMTLDEHLDHQYHKGIWDGLQIAWNIISEGR